MANSPATWEGRRALTDSPQTSPETYRAAARRLMELDQLSEAAVFFGLAGDEDGLREIISLAAGEGNFFLFRQAAGYLRQGAVDRGQALDLKTAAENHGRILYAQQAAAYLEEHFK